MSYMHMNDYFVLLTRYAIFILRNIGYFGK